MLMKNTLTTNKLECFYNSYYIYRFTLSATHSGGWGRPQSAFWYPNAMLAGYFRTLFKETIPSVQPFYINSHPYYLSSPYLLILIRFAITLVAFCFIAFNIFKCNTVCIFPACQPVSALTYHKHCCSRWTWKQNILL